MYNKNLFFLQDTVPMEVLKNRQSSILYSVISCESTDVINNEVFIHCWDGNDFFELTSFKYPKDITNLSTGKNMLAGMQIAARSMQPAVYSTLSRR